MRPYIGMTDVPSAEWLGLRLDAYKAAGGCELYHQLHAGIMMSWKSLNGFDHKYKAVWPENREIAGIFVRHPSVLNVLHYADYDAKTGFDDLDRAVSLGGGALDGLQLDMPWPDTQMLAVLKTRHHRLRIILQVGERALAEIGDDPKRLLERLRAYDGIISDVLLDKSGGKGVPLDAVVLRPFVEVLYRHRSDFGVTVAGGLGPDTLDRVAPLARDFPKLSIDAQGALRASRSSKIPIEADRTDAYLRGAVEMFLATIPTGVPV